MDEDLLLRIAKCERTNRRLNKLLVAHSAILLGCIAGIVTSCMTATPLGSTSSAVTDRLRVKELVVVDPQGHERVMISGDVPDAIIDGKRVPRGETASGILLYDDQGNERSGYVTWAPSGNAGLTLDTRKQQVALFVAGPDSGSALQLWQGRDAVEFRSDANGPRVTAVKQGEVVFQEPAVKTMVTDTCAAYREATGRVSAEQVMHDCRRRFSAAPCQDCLGKE
jgi:hypothetical protein